MADREVLVPGAVKLLTLSRPEGRIRLSGGVRRATFLRLHKAQPGKDDLILDEDRLDGTTFSGFPAGIFEIIRNVIFDLRHGYITLHFEDFRTDFDASLTSNAQFFIHPYSHGFPLDGV